MDCYTEQLYRVRKRPREWIAQGAIVVGLISGCAAMLFFLPMIAPNFGRIAGLMLTVIVAYAAIKYQWYQQFDREYEYLYFNGDIDIDRITAKSTRKRILSLKASDVQRFGKYRDSLKTNTAFDKILDVTSGYDTGNPICFLVLHTREFGNTLLLFEPKEEILTDMKRRVQIPFEE